MAQSEPNRYALLVGCNYPRCNYPDLTEEVEDYEPFECNYPDLAEEDQKLFGRNYPDLTKEVEDFELFGCVNDVLNIRDVLINRFGFHENNIKVLTDDPSAADKLTTETIRQELEDLVDKAEPGDVLFFHFSGHGTFIDDASDHSHDDPTTTWNLLTPGSDEAIVGPDLNLITELDFRKLVDSVPDGATFTIFSDSCHSGGLLANGKEQIGPHHSIPGLDYEVERRKKFIPIKTIMQHLRVIHHIPLSDSHHLGDLLEYAFGEHAVSPKFKSPIDELDLETDAGILLSACQADEIAHEFASKDGTPVGAFSYAMQMLLQDNPKPLTNREVVTIASIKIREEGYRDQHPCLYSSDENADAFFLHQSDP